MTQETPQDESSAINSTLVNPSKRPAAAPVEREPLRPSPLFNLTPIDRPLVRGIIITQLDMINSAPRLKALLLLVAFAYCWGAALMVGLSWWRSAISVLVVMTIGYFSLSHYLRLEKQSNENLLERLSLRFHGAIAAFFWTMLLLIPLIVWLSLGLFFLASIPTYLSR